ncbi:Protein of unknown function [Gryllus bimaculatus]|nr:Protein of unknown function [Gryllus bimaculatus]
MAAPKPLEQENLEIRTKSIEQTLIPLVKQKTVNWLYYMKTETYMMKVVNTMSCWQLVDPKLCRWRGELQDKRFENAKRHPVRLLVRD